MTTKTGMNNRTKGRKRIAVVALAAALATAWMVQPGFAVELDPTVQACTVTVETPVGAEFAELSDTAVTLDFYEVAKAENLEGYDAYTYSYVAPFAADESMHIETLIKAAEAEGREITAAEIDSMTQKMAATVLADGISVSPAATGTLDTAVTLPEAGMYLIIPHGDLEDYVDRTGGVISTIAETASKQVNFAPILITAPSRGVSVIGEGTVAGNAEWTYPVGLGNTAAREDWIYDVVITAKAGIMDRLGSLKLTKTLTMFEHTDEQDASATFVFDVEVTKNSEKVYSDVHTFVFTAAGDQTIVIGDLPIGATAVITEEYPGGNYELESGSYTVEVQIIGDDPETADVVEMAEASFTNTWTGTWNGGGSVVNHFEADEHGWNSPQSTKSYSDGTEKGITENDF